MAADPPHNLTAPAAASDLTTIAALVSRAIAAAWREEEASPGSDFKPGVLTPRPADGVAVPTVALRHSYDVATYVNHATSAALRGKLLGGLRHRDARDNLAQMAPPLAADGVTPLYAPNGKPRVTSEPLGASFEVDGYAVTYKAGVTWKFLLGFDPDGGLTMYHLRFVTPPSQAHPKGKEEQYLFRAYIPDFGTDYSAGNLGNPNSYLFHEHHYRSGTGLKGGVDCSGRTLPLFRSLRGPYIGDKYNQPISYSSYGLNVPDPLSLLFGKLAPLQEFAVGRGHVDNGLIEEAVCLQGVGEAQEGARWAALRLRAPARRRTA